MIVLGRSDSAGNRVPAGRLLGSFRAERFWESLGYIEARTRFGVEMGKLTHTLRVMFKPLCGSRRRASKFAA